MDVLKAFRDPSMKSIIQDVMYDIMKIMNPLHDIRTLNLKSEGLGWTDKNKGNYSEF